MLTDISLHRFNISFGDCFAERLRGMKSLFIPVEDFYCWFPPLCCGICKDISEINDNLLFILKVSANICSLATSLVVYISLFYLLKSGLHFYSAFLGQYFAASKIFYLHIFYLFMFVPIWHISVQLVSMKSFFFLIHQTFHQIFSWIFRVNLECMNAFWFQSLHLSSGLS